MYPHASPLRKGHLLYCFLHNNSHFASCFPFSTSVSGSSPWSSKVPAKKMCQQVKFIGVSWPTQKCEPQVSPKERFSYPDTYPLEYALILFTCGFSRDTSYLLDGIRVWSSRLGRVALMKASWDYSVAVTEKPNPNWLSPKGNLLTQKLKGDATYRQDSIQGSGLPLAPASF